MKNKFHAKTNSKAVQIARQGLPALTLCCLLLSTLAGVRGGSISNPTAGNAIQKGKILVSAVSGTGDSELNMDAVVMVEQGKLSSPYAEDKEGEQTRFANEYFRTGRKYRLTFGGGDAGTATIADDAESEEE